MSESKGDSNYQPIENPRRLAKIQAVLAYTPLVICDLIQIILRTPIKLNNSNTYNENNKLVLHRLRETDSNVN